MATGFMNSSNNSVDSLKNKVCIPVDIEIRDGCSAYALSLQMIFQHVADFHITVIDVISDKYNIPVDDIMNVVTSDSRYKNMVVDKDIHRLGTVVGAVNESEKKKDETLLKTKTKPSIVKKIDGEKKIKIKIKPVPKTILSVDGVDQCD
jgi:hypothetical protein